MYGWPPRITSLFSYSRCLIKGDATDDKSLIRAGIKRARGVIYALPTDAENLYVILTSKELNAEAGHDGFH